MQTFLQGFNFRKEVKAADSLMTLYDGINKYSVSGVVQTEDGFFLEASAEETSKWAPSSYKYQVINSEGLEEEGQIKVKANYAITDSAIGYWEKVIKNIDDRLAGRATDPAYRVQVGDKEIVYYTIDELLKLRQFAVQRLAEDEEAPSPNDERRIRFRWHIR